MAAKEVSCKIIPVFIKSLKENNVAPDILCKGIPYELNYLTRRNAYVEWDVLCKILSNLREIWIDDEYFIELGKQLVDRRLVNLSAVLAGFFVNVKDIYRMINDPKKGFGNHNVKCITPSSKEIEAGHLEVTLELPIGYQNCKDFFLITKGFFSSLPLLLKLNPAKVMMRETEHGAVYNILYPQSKSRLSFITNIFSSPSSKQAAVAELNEAYELLYDRFYQLEESKAKTQLQATQLEIAYNFGQSIGGDLDLDSTMKTVVNSLLNIEEFAAVDLKVDTIIDSEPLNRIIKSEAVLPDVTVVNRKLESRGQRIGEINLYIKEKASIGYVNRLLDFIIPTISSELLSTFSYKLLNDYRNKLEQKVTDRTRQLDVANKELSESLQKLKSLKDARDRFFTGISHEFRTPLTLILSPSENIISNSAETETRKKAELIKQNAHRMLKLINQLLDLAKLDAGKMQLKVSKGNIVHFIRGVTMSFESLAESKDIKLKVFSSDNEIELYFNTEVMMKVMTNLLSNAFKFTESGGMIKVLVSKTGRNSVEIIVRDSGLGIPESQLSKLFDRFYQVDNSRTRKYEGTGIGLALTKELLELHHGTIKVASKLRQSGVADSGWTEFKIELPLGIAHLNSDEILEDEVPDFSLSEADEIQIELLASSEISKDGIYESDKTIVLVVEDNPDLREMIKENLQDTYAVLIAENGVIGFKLAEENIPDLIISDIMMPEMDGYELTKRIKTNEKTNHIPVILLTAKAATEDKLEGLETGADDYLIKPFNEKELTIRVRNLIKIRQQMREKYLAQSLDKPGSVVVLSTQKVFINKLTSIIDKNISNENFSVTVLCREIGMSRTQLHRKIKSVTNQSTTEFIRNYKLQLAAELLKKDTGNIAEISNEVGFNSQAYFTKLFQELYGVTPFEYKKQHSK